MLYPQNGSIANGSRRSSPTVPSAAAVRSEEMFDPRKTPWVQSVASSTSGTFVARRPPKRIASSGTPSAASQSSAICGHCAAATVKRELGCAAGRPDAGVQGLPSQSVSSAGGVSVRPSHHTSPSGRSATLVKIVLPQRVSTAATLVDSPVPGATPKKPASGLIAHMRPSSPGRSHAMSSPRVSTRHPGMVGRSIARLVLPHADGNAAATWYFFPFGSITRMRSMCSASQPSSRPMTEAMRSAKHFFARIALPP